MTAGSTWQTLKKAAGEWSEDKASRLAAALAFYTMLSIAPLLVIVIKIVGAVFGSKAAQGQLYGYIHEVVGSNAAQQIQTMVAKADEPGAGVMATVISSVILVFSATGVFAELQDSMNTIWDVQPRPDRPWWGIIKDRLFSFTLVLGLAFLLLVSLILSSVLTIVSNYVLGSTGWLVEALHFVVSFVVIAGLFGVLFKYLPDVKIRWRDVWLGAVVTAVLFTVGKFLLGWYLGRASTLSVYGAAGSLVALLLWVYYSAQIFFFGAEFTQVRVTERGGRGPVAENAIPMTDEARAHQGLPRQADLATAARQTEFYLHHGGMPAGPAGRRLVVDRPRNAATTPLAAGAGLVAGLAVGAWAAWDRLRRRQLDKDMLKVNLDGRLNEIESRMSRIQAFKKYARDYATRDRIDQAERQLHHVGQELRRLERNPEVAPTLQDRVRYLFGLPRRRPSFGRRLARALHVDHWIPSER